MYLLPLFSILLNISLVFNLMPNICLKREFFDHFCDDYTYEKIVKDVKNKPFSAELFVNQARFIIKGLATELWGIKSQKLKMLLPTRNFPYCPKTIYFENNPKINSINKDPNIKKIPFEIEDKKFMVTYKGYKNIQDCLTGPLTYNGMIRTVVYKDCNLVWRLLKGEERHQLIERITKYQKFNHWPFSEIFHDKSILYIKYLEMKQLFPEEYNYMPYTYILPLEIHQYNYFKNYKFDKNNLWIIKPKNNSRGRGIHLLENIETIPKEGLLSKYISNPLLVNGKKFDLRIYVVITGFKPLKIYLYKDGLTRFAGEKYNLEENNLSNSFIHLTNYAINKESPNFEFNDSVDKEFGLKWTISTIKEHLRKKGIDFNKIWENIKDIIIKLFISYAKEACDQIENYFVENNNLFELYGLDILIDDTLKPWLMEVNINPSIDTESLLDLKIKSEIMTDIFNIIGLIPYSHGVEKVSLEREEEFESKTEEAVYNSFCEFERPKGKFERIFPILNNIKKYEKYFIQNNYENTKLWNEMIKLNYSN